MSIIGTIKSKAQSIFNKAAPIGPLSALDSNKYQMADTLTFPSNVGKPEYPHFVKFTIYVQNESAFKDTVGGGITDSVNDVAKENAQIPLEGIGTVAGIITGTQGVQKVATAIAENGISGGVGALFGATVKTGAVVAGAKLIGQNLDFSRKTKQIKQQIHLYIPETVQQVMVNNYDITSITEALGALGLGSAGLGQIKDYLAKDLGSSQTNGTLLDSREAIEALGYAAGKLGYEGLTSSLLFSKGVALNPQYEVLYKSTNNREFQFDFKMTPKNAEEASQMLSIIKAFKFHAAPEIAANGNGRYLIPPSEFSIEFCFRENFFTAEGVDYPRENVNKSLHRIANCVLEGVDVNYVTTGQFATYDDGTPVEIAMTLRFRETVIITKDLVEKGY